MDVKRSRSQNSSKGPAEYFTGTVRIDPLFQAPDPARVACASVTFGPGARTPSGGCSLRETCDMWCHVTLWPVHTSARVALAMKSILQLIHSASHRRS
jgi:hypothetical protein